MDSTNQSPNQPYTQYYPERKRYSTARLWLYAISLSLGSFQLGYGMGVYNPINKVLMKIYSVQCDDCWDIDKNKQPFNTLVSTVLFVGAFTGSATANFFVYRSRILAMYVFCLMCVVGSVLELIVNLPLLMIGRFIQGLGGGGFSNLVPMMINEISPPSERGKTGTLVQITINVAFFTSTGLGLALPKDVKDVKESDILWRIITGFPILIGALMLILFLTVYRYDTPVKYLQKGQENKALQAIQKVYTKEGAEFRLKELKTELQNKLQQNKLRSSQSSSQSQNTSISKKSKQNPQALKNNPTVVIIICIILAIYQQLTGMNGIIFYSAQIFENNTDPGNIYDGNKVAILTTSVNLVAGLISMLFIDRFGRKPLLLIGSAIMTIFIILTGLFEQLNNTTLQQVSVLIFIAGFAISMGPVFWAYIPEVINAGGLSISSVSIWIFVILLSLGVPTMSKLNEWMFYIFGILNALGFIFILIFVIESKGKTRIQMQKAYVHKFTKTEMEEKQNLIVEY